MWCGGSGSLMLERFLSSSSQPEDAGQNHENVEFKL